MSDGAPGQGLTPGNRAVTDYGSARPITSNSR